MNMEDQEFIKKPQGGHHKNTLISKKSTAVGNELFNKEDTQIYCHFKFENLKYRRDNWVFGHFCYV